MKYNNPPLENIEAEALANWLRFNNYRFTHIANESGLPPKVAMKASARKKRMGVSPGVPDFMILLKRNSLLFIELKRKKKSLSKVSQYQLEWIQALNEVPNIEAVICYGAEKAIQLIQEYENR